MRKILILAILFTGIANGQVFSGKGDAKFQIGANFQNKGNGIIATFDKGINQNMSFAKMLSTLCVCCHSYEGCFFSK